MRVSIWNRDFHRKLSITIALPLSVIICTGILLQLKKDFAWLQPPTRQGAGGPPSVSFDRILEAARSVPEAGIRGWEDISRLDVRPGKGIVKVRSVNDMEVQVDTRTGAVLQVAYRRSHVIEHIHDGSYFHAWVKRGIFLPAAFLLLGLLGTGLYLFALPHWVKWKRQ